MTPQLWVFAGPNGAGQSTIADRYAAGRGPVVNPDTIARELPPDLDQLTRAVRAGRIAVRQRAALLEARQSFAIETTLTGHSELDLMRAAAAAGFKVNLIYLGVRDVQHSIGRVRERTARGGHDVALADLLRRFDRSLANLRVAMKFADRVILIDNSGRRRQLVLVREGDRVKYIASERPEWVLEGWL